MKPTDSMISKRYKRVALRARARIETGYLHRMLPKYHVALRARARIETNWTVAAMRWLIVALRARARIETSKGFASTAIPGLPSARGHELKLERRTFRLAGKMLPSARGHELKLLFHFNFPPAISCPPREGTN